jgi:uncharacterized damage-inducible protein DinB
MRLSSRSLSLFACCLVAVSTSLVQAQMVSGGPAPGTHVSPSATFDKMLTDTEKELVDAAEAMPAEKYSFKPSVPGGAFDGVRSFGDEIKHVTQANDYFFHDPETPLVDTRKEIDALKTKDEIVKALKDSFALGHKYISTITDANDFEMTKSGTRGGMASYALSHMMDHYGQMVVYLRMNGIVPPASVKK